jgi:membrane protein
VLIVQSWLLGVGWVIYGGQLVGRWFYDPWLRTWAENHWGHRPPSGGRKGYGQDSEPAHEDPDASPQ